jgi:hypothetical protein
MSDRRTLRARIAFAFALNLELFNTHHSIDFNARKPIDDHD